MYLQFACNVTAMGNDSMNGEVEFVGDGFVGHALHNAGDDFFFALAQGFLFAVFFLFLLGVQQVVDLEVMTSMSSHMAKFSSYSFNMLLSMTEHTIAMYLMPDFPCSALKAGRSNQPPKVGLMMIMSAGCM